MMKDRIAALELSQRVQFDIERRFHISGTEARQGMYEQMNDALDETLFSARMAAAEVPRSDIGNVKEFAFDGQIKYFYGKFLPVGADYKCRAVASVTVIRER